jgi:hypothetical protein
MTQSTTTRYNFRYAPGHVYTPEGPGRETEAIVIPLTAQQITFTLAGADPITAGDYEYRFVAPSLTGAFTVTVTQAAVTPTAASVIVAAALNADPNSGQLFSWTSALGVVTGVAKSADTSIAVPTTTTNAPTTNTAAISVAAAANALRMGVWYVYGSTTYTSGAISNTPRGAFPAILPSGSSTVALLRGVVGRPDNQTEQPFNSPTSTDRYEAGQVGFGLLRGRVCTVVDPASTTMNVGSAVYVVIASGTYSVIGSVGVAADGGNTLRVDNTTPVRARVVMDEETLTIGSYSGRCVLLQVNQTN